MSDQQGYRPSGYSDPGPDYGTPYHQQSAPNLGYQGQPGYGQQPGYGAVGQQQPYQQQGYGPGYGAYVPAPEHPQSQMVFILGIVGIFTGVTAFVAWYMGGQAKKEIDAGAPYQWGGNLKTGYMLGKIFSIITIVGGSLMILFYIAYFIFLFSFLGMY